MHLQFDIHLSLMFNNKVMILINSWLGTLISNGKRMNLVLLEISGGEMMWIIV